MSTAPTSNGVFVVIPPSNASGLRPPPAILPTSMCQPPGVMQFEEPPLRAQTPRATQAPDLQPMETFLTGEPKALGTVQILIGLIHLGFGSVLLMVRRGHVGMLFIESGVPFWGGACFIISGSLSVAAEKSHTSCLVRSSLGTNILSATAAFAGTAILLMDFGVTNWNPRLALTVGFLVPRMWAGAIWLCLPSSPSWSSLSQSLPPTSHARPPALKPTRL
nr:PREDICTED: membrane-spanning 4-domains subfamily A member 15 isoform X2 [Rhinolophus sinicus]